MTADERVQREHDPEGAISKKAEEISDLADVIQGLIAKALPRGRHSTRR